MDTAILELVILQFWFHVSIYTFLGTCYGPCFTLPQLYKVCLFILLHLHFYFFIRPESFPKCKSYAGRPPTSCGQHLADEVQRSHNKVIGHAGNLRCRQVSHCVIRSKETMEAAMQKVVEKLGYDVQDGCTRSDAGVSRPFPPPRPKEERSKGLCLRDWR